MRKRKEVGNDEIATRIRRDYLLEVKTKHKTWKEKEIRKNVRWQKRSTAFHDNLKEKKKTIKMIKKKYYNGTREK